MSHKSSVEDSTEKRAFFRINTEIPLTFCLDGELEQPLPKSINVNLSVGGAGLLTERNLTLGDSLSLAIFLPTGPPICGHAKVVRNIDLSKIETTPLYQIGLQFIALDEKSRERLNAYIFKLQVERRRTRYVV
jgi:c-di-GMP-binding flagellar brake protein YcgR